jgi:DNA polymerase-3 subunit delta
VDPAQFLIQLRKSGPAPGCVFLGNELFVRDRCRRELLAAALPGGEGELLEYDLAETSVGALLEDARTLSLFARARVITGYNAEAVLTRVRDSADEEASSAPFSEALEEYFRRPTPGVLVLIEALRLNWDDRDEKKKLERLAKAFAAVPVKVEFRRLSPREALEAARALVRENRLKIAEPLLVELAEALGHDMPRIAGEIRKLALYAGPDQEITGETLAALVPEARTSGLFELTDALSTRNRVRALEILDTLIRMDVYLPLQVSFLASVFRYALAVKEAGARNPREVMSLCSRIGLPVWPARAQQALDTANRFTREQLERAVHLLFETDRDLRRDRPDDRIVMERLVWALTK